MNKDLEESIKHWERILTGEDLNYDGEDCPLCNNNLECSSCIIAQTTGEINCEGTPWHPFHQHVYDVHNVIEYDLKPDTVKNCEKCQSLAKDEIDFLKSLRGECDESGS